MVLFERYIVNDDQSASVRGPFWLSQAFTVGTVSPNFGHTIKSVNLKLYKGLGSPGNVTVAIYGTRWGKPYGSPLCSDVYNGNIISSDQENWEEFTFSSPATLLPDTQYAIVISAPDGDSANSISWRMNTIDPLYAGGKIILSSNSGTNWAFPYIEADFMFEEYSETVFLLLSEIVDLTSTAENFYSPLRLSEIMHLTDTFTSVSNKPVYYYEPSTVSQFTIQESDVLKFSGLTQDDSTLRNDIIVIGDSVSATTNDSTSIDTYGRYAFRYEDTEITDSNDAVLLASQILTNYKDPKTIGSIEIKGKTGLNTRSQFTLNLPNIGISNEKYEIVQYQHMISDKGFYTKIYFGEVPWDITREVANLIRKVY